MKEMIELNKEIEYEIETYKYLESEKAGKDIGYDSAINNWLEKHFPGWIAYRKKKLIEEIIS